MVSAEADLLRQGGHEVVQHYAENPASTIGAAAALAASPWNPVSAAAVRRRVHHLRPDVVHVHNTWFAMSAAVIEGLARLAPVVVTLHNFRLACVNGLLFRDGHPCEDCVGTHPLAGVRHRCYKSSAAASAVAAGGISLHRALRTWTRADLVLTMTEFGRKMALASGVAPEVVQVKPHFVADPGPREMPPSASPQVLFVGRLSPEKGIEVLLEAWSAADVPGLELVVVGDGPARAAIERRLPPRVTLSGSRSPMDVTRLMLEARALIFPSLWYETFGRVLAEAMAAGLPVVASELGGTPEVVGVGAGWMTRAGDAGELSSALERLADGEAIDRAGQGARRRYEERYTPADGLANLERVYGDARAHFARRPARTPRAP